MSGDENYEIYICSSSSRAASTEQIKILSHELDCLGLPTINVNVDILQQLIGSINRLMSLYKKNLSQQKEIQLKATIIQNEKLSQQKVIENCNGIIKDKEDEIKKLKDALLKKEMQISDLKEANNSISKDFDALRSLYHRKESESSHALLKLQLDNKSLMERLGEEVGKYKSQDSLLVETLNKYTIKVGIYEETINKLQNNNEELLNEILNLKEEVLLSLQNSESSFS